MAERNKSSLNPLLSLFARSLDSLPNAALCCFWPLQAEHFVSLAYQLVVVDEEIFEFASKFLAQIIHVLDVGEAVVILLNGYDAVVAFCFLLR
jgi:hypothetical protein